MPAYTPIWQLPYPCLDEVISPDIFCEFSEATDAALNVLGEKKTFALNRPAAKLIGTSTSASISAGVDTTLTFTSEDFDNDNLIDTASLNLFTIRTPGLYNFVLNLPQSSSAASMTDYLISIKRSGSRIGSRKFRTFINRSDFVACSTYALCTAGQAITATFLYTGSGSVTLPSGYWMSASYVCST